VLLILDNLDLEKPRDVAVSAMLDQLVLGCSRLSVLVTCRRSFYRGRFNASHVTYRLPDLRHSADQLFLQVRFLPSNATYASAGTSCGPVSVSVCHKSVFLSTTTTLCQPFTTTTFAKRAFRCSCASCLELTTLCSDSGCSV